MKKKSVSIRQNMVANKKRKLMPHQSWCLKQIAHKPGVFLPCGAGKTLVVIRYIVKHSLFPALIVCRKDDVLTWRTELENEGFLKDNVSIVKKEYPASYRKWTIVTYDKLKNIESKPIILNDFQVAVADESWMIKRWKARRTKILIRRTKRIPHRIAISATPTTQDISDVFTQSLFMDSGVTFGDSYWGFRNKYYVQLPHGGWALRKGAKETILKKFEKLSITIDDPIKIPTRRLIKSCPVSGSQRRMQERLLKDWEYQLTGGGIIELKYVISQLGKLKQVASGFIYDEGGVAHWMKSYKLDLLKKLVTNPDMLGAKPKLVIWCAFIAEIEKIHTMFNQLGVKAVTFYGKSKKNDSRKHFKTDPKTRLFIGQVDSGVGMNELGIADTAIYFSNSPRVLSRKQSEGRLKGKRSVHKHVTYYDLVTDGTADWETLRNLQNGVSLSDYVLQELRNGQQLSNILRIGAN